jgi:hypothetical protein
LLQANVYFNLSLFSYFLFCFRLGGGARGVPVSSFWGKGERRNGMQGKQASGWQA